MIKPQLLTWDTDFFGIKIYKIEVSRYSAHDIEKSVQAVFDSSTELIYLIIPDDIDQKVIFQNSLVDQKVIYEKKLKNLTPLDPHIIEYSGGNVPQKLYDIALESGIYSRFKLDSKFPAGSYEKLYRKWIEKSVSGEIADKVFVYKENEDILGLISLKIKSYHGEIGLLAADNSSQGKGIGSKMISESENYLISRNIYAMEVATQLKNDPACRFYKKNGYSIKNIFNYYHIWKN